MKLRYASALCLLVAACGPQDPGNTTEDATITNATDNYEGVMRDTDERADRLDELGEQKDAEGNRIGGAGGQDLHNAADADFAEASTVRAAGQRAAVRTEDQIEADAGLLNHQ